MTPPKYSFGSLNKRPPGWRRLSNSPPAAIVATLNELAWAAGFLEGEGSFSRTQRNHMRVCAEQTTTEPLDRLLRLFGGSLHTGKKRSEKWNICHSWYVTSDRARGVVLTLYQFMSPRRRLQIRQMLMLPDIVEEPPFAFTVATSSTAALHWVAGFLEAEGHFGAIVEPKNSLTTHKIEAAQVQRWPLDAVVGLFGGSLALRTPKPSQRAKSPAYRWTVHGPRARGVMLTLYSLLSSRRQLQIAEALTKDHRLCIKNRCA